MFQKAERRKAKARIGICGPAGSGKTYSALQLAFGLAPGGKVAVIDTEHGSAELYADKGNYDCATIEPPYTVEKYLELIKFAGDGKYDVVIIDSLTHAWAGEGGLLDRQQKITQASSHKNSYMAWREVTPLHNKLIDAILASPCHVIATMRTKTEYVLQENSKGKKMPVKVGMAPVQREGMDYEFTLVFDIEQEKHYATTSKDRTDLFNGFTDILSPEHGEMIRSWLEGGSDKAAPAPVEQPQPEEDKEALDKARKATHALLNDNNLKHDDLKAWGFAALGKESTTKFTLEDWRTAYKAVKDGKVTVDANADLPYELTDG